MPATILSEKKKALMAYKQKLIEDLKYYDKQIENFRSTKRKEMYFEDSDSSGSDTELSSNADFGPNLSQLKLQQTMMKTCLQATQELTNVQIMESEVNVLSEDPAYQGDSPVSEPGLWREVTAECRVDLVPFCITFFTHQPNRLFAPVSYRNLHVTAVKAAHEAELKRSILSTVKKPSDAVEILKNYAIAHRSRRTTLAKLAEKFANSLYMEPMSDGGYHLKCANLLEVSWFLQNKWSPVASFQHRMKFELEYMDEAYIKKITVLHRQLTDPSIETDERTFLLSKIISICLEAQGPTQELYESMSSDPETAHALRKRRTTLDKDIEPPVIKKKKDTEVMAPPKSLPKKAKPKGKENVSKTTEDAGKGEKTKKSTQEIANNDKTKIMSVRNLTEPVISTNKKSTFEKANTEPNLNKKLTEKNKENANEKPSVDKTVNSQTNKTKSDGNKEILSKTVKENKQRTSDKKPTEGRVIAMNKPKTNQAKSVKEKGNKEVIPNDVNNVAKTKTKVNSAKATTGNNVVSKKTNSAEEKLVNEKKNKEDNPPNAENVAKTTKVNSTKSTKENNAEAKSSNSAKEKPVKEKLNAEIVAKPKNNINPTKPIKKNAEMKKANSVANINNIPPKPDTEKSPSNDKQVQNNEVKSVSTVKSKLNPTKSVKESNKENSQDTNKKKEDRPKYSHSEKAPPKNVASLKRKSNLVEKVDQGENNVATAKKPKLSKPNAVTKNVAENKTKTHTIPKPKSVTDQGKPKTISVTNKFAKPGNIGKVFSVGNIGKSSAEKVSRIPQIKSINMDTKLTKNPLKLTPTRSNTKVPSTIANKQKIAKSTNIPRLLKKPSPKS